MPTTNDLEYKFLPFVKNPAQYIGAEVNMVRKDWSEAAVTVALAFPDAYTVGSSSLAVHIIYDLLNRMPNVLCQRVFCPLPDAADRLRQVNLPLYALESHRPIRQFDILAFSVQYEMLYTNLLEMLDLAQIPMYAEQRTDDGPLVLIGGSQANNPEPLADFIDLAILGEAEACLPQFVTLYRQLKGQLNDRRELIAELARNLPWLYAPSLYDVAYHPDGAIKSVRSTEGAPMPVQKAYVKDLDKTDAPTRPIVPYVRTIHERINIEIMRGCPHACRFCHEGYTRRPVRFRSRAKIVQLARETFANTGLSDISLFSLSSADHPELVKLFDQLNAIFTPRHVSISLPSLRAEKQLELVPASTSLVRKPPLTIAIESADPVVRKVINKPIDEQAVLAAVEQAYQCGWRHVKLYFMIGLPGEQFDASSADRIVQFADDVAHAGAKTRQRPANVTISASFFVPKPHTPLQWLGQRDIKYFTNAKDMLRAHARSRRYLTLRFHNQHRSRLEAIFARGDRRLGRVLYLAWKAGARFDAWNELFNHEHFQHAFDAAGVDPSFYADRNIALDQILPWDHLRPGPDRAVLLRQLRYALKDIGGVEKFFGQPWEYYSDERKAPAGN